MCLAHSFWRPARSLVTEPPSFPTPATKLDGALLVQWPNSELVCFCKVLMAAVPASLSLCLTLKKPIITIIIIKKNPEYSQLKWEGPALPRSQAALYPWPSLRCESPPASRSRPACGGLRGSQLWELCPAAWYWFWPQDCRG